MPIVRLTTADGAAGIGWARITAEQARDLVGLPLQSAFDGPWTTDTPIRVAERFREVEYPLYDLAGQLAGQPVYALLGGRPGDDGLYRAPCYDTSLYMDDLHVVDDDQAAALIAAEALEGAARGHRAFKIKVGRGAMHMPLEAGTRRDIRVIHAVRNAVGPQARIMIDANNGYNVNLVKHVLTETAEAVVHWIEEPFHEDPRLYAHLKEWLGGHEIHTLIADGEGEASRSLLDWARQGLIDVVQYDVFRPGFTRWLEVGPQLDTWGARSAPHHYGEPFGNYAACHLAEAIRRFEGVEWDEATVPGLDVSGYLIVEGMVRVPNLPGFGLGLEEGIYARAVQESGFVVE